EEVSASYFAGVLAREVAQRTGAMNAEEAFICGMFQRLGRLLVTFYLHEEKAAIERLAQTRGWDQSRAAREGLGIGYEELGMGVARHWNFPEMIVASMRPVTQEAVSRADFKTDELRIVAGAASELCDTVRAATPGERSSRLDAVSRKYGGGVSVVAGNVREIIKSAFGALARESVIIGTAAATTEILERPPDSHAPPGLQLP